MSPASLLEDLSPYARVTTAIAPFIAAIFLRLILGSCRLTRVLFSISSTWLVVNVLMAPYSVRMQKDIENLRAFFH